VQFWARLQAIVDIIWSTNVVAMLSYLLMEPQVKTSACEIAIGGKKKAGSILVLKEKLASQGLSFIFGPKECSRSRKLQHASTRDRAKFQDTS
jgi:hypothetical protein